MPSVRLRVSIDGEPVVDRVMDVKDQHNVKRFDLALEPGDHTVTVRLPDRGEQATSDFVVKSETWLSVTYRGPRCRRMSGSTSLSARRRSSTGSHPRTSESCDGVVRRALLLFDVEPFDRRVGGNNTTERSEVLPRMARPSDSRGSPMVARRLRMGLSFLGAPAD